MEKKGTKNLDSFRTYLLHLARLHLNSDLHVKCSPSDLVQETLLEAHKYRDHFQGGTFARQAAWLCKILVNRAAKIGRDMRRLKRDFRREQSLQASVLRSSARLQEFLSVKAPSPSDKAIKNEHLLIVSATLEELPDVQRDVIILHFIEGQSMDEIGRRIGRTSAASAGLLHRGLKRLRSLLKDKM